jgi:hypothetical protein
MKRIDYLLPPSELLYQQKFRRLLHQVIFKMSKVKFDLSPP